MYVEIFYEQITTQLLNWKNETTPCYLISLTII